MTSEVFNPYHMRGMIPIDSDMFFGRDKELRHISGMLSLDTPQCISIIGERRIGKSSLAFRVCHKIKNSKNTLAIYLDCDGLAEGCQSKDHFFGFLSDKLFDFPDNKAKLKECIGSEERKLFNTYDSFRSFIRNTGGRGIKTIIFLDEFEHLLSKNFANDIFFSNLRFIASHPEHCLAFCTISKTSLKELTHKSIKSSGFWNIFIAEPIGLLDHTNIEQLRMRGFETTGIPFTNSDLERIDHYAGDFPFFNQVVCGFIWDSKRDETIPDWNKLEVEIFSYYEKIWEDRTKEEQELLKNLRNKDDHFPLKIMKDRGIVMEKGGKILPFSNYFAHLIKKNLKVKRRKTSVTELIQKIQEGLDIMKKGKDLIKG